MTKFEDNLENKKTEIDELSKNSKTPTYIGITINKEVSKVYEMYTSAEFEIEIEEDFETTIIDFLKHSEEFENLKIVSASIYSEDYDLEKLSSDLWLGLDIVPNIIDKNVVDFDVNSARELAYDAAGRFNKQHIVDVMFKDTNEVDPSFLVVLDQYMKTTDKKTWERFEREVEKFKGKKITFFSATPRGGGVALMRHAMIRLYRLMGVDAHWHVLDEKIEVFDVTKRKFHNVLQAVASKDVELTPEDEQIYNEWIKENADKFQEVFETSDVIVIDDPQPSGMIDYIREIDPQKPILYRSHIQIEAHLADTPGTPQEKTWNFIWENIKTSNCFIAHPIDGFVPKTVPDEKVVFMPATTDPLDGLNKYLSEDQMDYYLNLFDDILLKNNNEPLDRTQPIITQIARFDPSKGIPDVVESYVLLRDKLEEQGSDIKPQLVIVGHTSVDDPDVTLIYNLTKEMLTEPNVKKYAEDIKVGPLPHIDQILNAILRASKIVLQLSHKEGFEIKVTEALMKGKPVISYRAGGIPLQIQNEKTGFIVEKIGDVETVAEKMFNLLTDDKLYDDMSDNAENLSRRDVLTVPNSLNWLFLANTYLENKEFNPNGKHIQDIIFEE